MAWQPVLTVFSLGGGWPGGGGPLPGDLYAVRGAQLHSLPAGMSLTFHFTAGPSAGPLWNVSGDPATSQSVHLCSRILSALPNICVLLIHSEHFHQLWEGRRCSEGGSAPDPGAFLTLSHVSLLDAVSAHSPDSVLFPQPSPRWPFTVPGERRGQVEGHAAERAPGDARARGVSDWGMPIRGGSIGAHLCGFLGFTPREGGGR